MLDRVAALERPAIEGLRWTRADQWHITLRFLGETDAVPATAALRSVEGAAWAEVGPAVGRFDHRILHLPVRGLESLARAVVAATRTLGRPPDDRPFRGHLTLARVTKNARIDLRRLTGAPLEGTWDVTSFCLVESRLSTAGSRYEVVEHFAL